MRPKEFCEALHISENVIKKYKKEGLFFPEHPSEGNRATDYTKTDMQNLKKLLVLSKAGLTCSDLKRLQGSETRLQEALKARRAVINDKMKKMRNSLDMLVTLLDDKADFNDFQTEHYWNDITEKEAAGEEFMDFTMYEYQPTPLERVVKCPHCGHQEKVDLEDFLYDESSSENENGMGSDIIYSFDSGESYECPQCGHIIQINTTVTHGLLLAFGIGALLNLLSLLIMKPYFGAFTNNEEIYQLSLAYMSVCSFMQIPNMVHIAIQKMIQATGNMIAPMWFQIAGVVVNFVFDPLLIFGMGVFPAMGIRGAAVATVAGYLLSMILAFALLLGKKQKVRIKIKEFHIQKRMIARIFALGLPSFIMNALSSFMVTFVNLFLVAYSDTAIAFFGAYFKVQQLIVMTVNGLIQGCLPIMRFNYGAGNRDRLHSAFRYGTALVSGMMILGTLTVNFFPAQLLELFTASEAMRSFGISAMRIMAASYLFCGLSTMISTYFQATEKVGSSIAIQLCRQLLFLVPALWCLNKLFQLNGIWLAFPVAETATMLIALIIMAWHRHKNIL